MQAQKLNLLSLNRQHIDEYKSSEKNKIIILLDNVRSMHNVGSVFRTADAFKVEKIILCGITAIPPHNEIRKTALGADESVNWEYFKYGIDTVKQLKEENYTIVCLEQTNVSVALQNFSSPQKAVYIFGNEVNGVGEDLIAIADTCVEIPQFGTKHSFNISVSVGIVLWNHFIGIK